MTAADKRHWGINRCDIELIALNILASTLEELMSVANWLMWKTMQPVKVAIQLYRIFMYIGLSSVF